MAVSFTLNNEAWLSVRHHRIYNVGGAAGGAPGAQVRVVIFPTRSTGSSKRMTLACSIIRMPPTG